MQRKGIRIGSCVTPLLSDIFLWLLEVSLEDAVKGEGVKNVFIDVDDFSVFR